MKSLHLMLVLAAFTWTQESGVWGQEPEREPEKKVVLPEGTQAFRNFVLHQEFNLTPLKTLKELSDKKPKETMLIVFGDTGVLDKIGSLEKFRQSGGAILIASDRNDRGRLKKEWKLRINGGVVTDDKTLAYRGIASCPRIFKPLADAHAIFQNVNQGIATNKPTVVQYADSDFLLLGRFSIWSRLDNFPLLGAFVVGRDRALVMGGHSVFMNVLLAQPDIDNYVFARNCVRWLSAGKRKYALFVEEGRIVDQFDVGLSVLPPIPMPPTEVLNRLLRGLEDESFFHRLLYRFFRRDQILRTLLLLATLVLLLYGCKRVIGARHRIEAAVPLLTPLPSPVATVELSLAAQRQKALLNSGDFREPTRELARMFFEELAPTPAPHAACPAPPYYASGNWLERRWLAKQLPYLWQLAYADPGRISKRQLRRLPGILDQLTQAFRAGRVQWLA